MKPIDSNKNPSAGLLAATAERGFLTRMRTRLPALGVGFAVLLLAVAGVASFLNTQRMIAASGWVERTHRVFERLESVLAGLQEIGAGVRGYVATGQEQFLAPVAGAREELAKDLAEARELIVDADQQAGLAALRPLIEQRLAHAEESVRLRREQGATAATAFVAVGEGERLVTEIRARIRAMQDAEQELLARRQADATASNATTFLALGFAGSVSLALLVALFATVWRLNRGLEARVRERTAEFQLSNRALRMLSDCNQTLIRADDEPRLLQAICDIVVQAGGHRLCFVGYAEHDEAKTVRVAARAGLELEATGLTWADTERGRAPVSVAIRTGQPAVVNALHADPGLVVWREVIRQLGLGSIAALPLKVDATVVGALVICAAEPNAFEAAELTLLTELAGDLAFGIATLRSRAARQQAEAAVRESDERYRNLVEVSPDAILVNRENRIVFINDTGLKLLGATTPAEVLGRSPLDFFHPDCHPLIRERVRRILEEKRPAGVAEQRLLRLDGAIVNVEVVATSFEEHGVTAIQVIVRDITERKQAAEELSRHRKHLEELVQERTAALSKLSRATEESPAIVVITDKDGTIEYVNPKFTQVTGYAADEVMGQKPRVLKSGVHPPEFYQSMWQAILSGQTWRGELCNRRKNGELFWESTNISPLLNPEGIITHFIAVKEDITARKQAGEALRESEEKLRLMAESFENVVWLSDPEITKIFYVNAAYERIWGRTCESVYESPQSFLDAVHPEDRERVLAHLEAHAQGKWDIEYRIVRPDGAIRWIRDQGHPIRDEQGCIYRMAGLAVDFTARKQAEDVLRVAHEALQRRTEELEVFNRAMVNREQRIIEMKEEVNALCLALGREPQYPPVWGKETS